MQIAIILLYFAVTIFIGVKASKKSDSAKSFHGAGLGVMACVAAGTGEWLGGTSTTGVSEYGFTYGLSGAWYSIANGIGICFLAIFFAKLYRSLDTVTVPGIMGHYVGGRARTVASCLLIFVMIAVGTSQVTAAGTLGVSLLGMNFNVAVLILGVVFIAYTIAGGMNAVASTNIMHLIAMYGGVILALAVIVSQYGGGDFLSENLDTEAYYSMSNIGMPKVSSWVIASLLGACTAQAGIQPILAAKDENTARKASFITAIVVAPFGLLTACLGMYAKACANAGMSGFETLTEGKYALNTLLLQLNPAIGGIVLASIFAAILSTISPIILASGTMFTKDLYEKFSKKEKSDKELLFISRAATTVAGVICIALSIVMNISGIKILDVVYFAYTLRGSLFIVLMYAIFWKKTSTNGAILAMLATAAVGFFWVVWNAMTGSYPIAPWITETYAAVVAAAVTTLLFSLAFPNKNRLEGDAK